MRNGCLLLVLLLALTGVGCAQKPIMDLRAVDMSPYRQTIEGVEIIIEPWNDDVHLKEIFRRSPKSLVAFRLTMKNQGSTTIRFSHTSAQLVTSSGETLSVIPPGELNNRLYDDASGAAALTLIVPYIGPIIGASIMGGASADSLRDQHSARDARMDLVLLDPGNQLTGFLFFDDSKQNPVRNGREKPLTLRINRVNRTQGDFLKYEFSVPVF